MLFRITVMEEKDLIKITQKLNSIRTDIKVTLLGTKTDTLIHPNRDTLTVIILGIPTFQEEIIAQITDIQHIQIIEETTINLIYSMIIHLLEHANQETINPTFIEATDQYKIIILGDLPINGTIIREQIQTKTLFPLVVKNSIHLILEPFMKQIMMLTQRKPNKNLITFD